MEKNLYTLKLLLHLQHKLFCFINSSHCLNFGLLIMIVKPLQTAWIQPRRRVTRRLVRFQAVCHSANMSSKF